MNISGKVIAVVVVLLLAGLAMQGLLLARVAALEVKIERPAAKERASDGDGVERILDRIEAMEASINEIKADKSLVDALEREREKTLQALARAAEAEQKLMDMAQESTRNSEALAELERKFRQTWKDKAESERRDESVKRKIDGKVVSYSRELTAVVINVGTDDGVTEGMQFSIYRPGKFVAQAVAKTVARSLTTATIESMQVEPAPGDECTNGLPLTPK